MRGVAFIDRSVSTQPREALQPAVEALTGERPFIANQPMAVMMMHLNDDAPPPIKMRPEIPQSISNVVERMIAKEPAERFENAGAFAVVLEKVPQRLADAVTVQVSIPTIGIGASAGCDGQILVVDDMLGLFTAFKPKFVKRYATLGADGSEAIAAYAEDVRARRFPAAEHVFSDVEPAA